MRTYVSLAFLLGLASFIGCKKAEDTRMDAPKRKPKRVKRAETNTLTLEEAKALAKERLAERVKTIKPFKRKNALRNLVHEMYKVDLDALLPNSGDEYDLSKLKNYDQVKDIINDRAAKQIAEMFTEDRRKGLEARAAEAHPLYKIGDVVTVRVRLANGSKLTHKGKLQSVAIDRIVVGGKKILFDDLADPRKVNFDEKEIMKRRRNYVFYRFTKPMSDEKLRIKKEIEPQVFAEFGFQEYNGRWRSMAWLVRKKVMPKLEEKEKKYLKKEKQKLKLEIVEDMKKEGLFPQ